MGGLGSGRPRRLYRRTTDELPRLDVNELRREGGLEWGEETPFRWLIGLRDEVRLQVRSTDHSLACCLTYARAGYEVETVAYTVPVSWTACNYGGQRPWLHCPAPSCGRRAVSLYLDGAYLVCRRCAGVRYESQTQSKHVRQVRKAQRIREALGGQPGLVHAFPPRPKGMHLVTYESRRREVKSAESAYLTAVQIELGQARSREAALRARYFGR